MIYLKLFEAFESSKLNKTLKFINTASRSSFLTSLKQIGDFLDFPISNFKDDYFEYLPFKSALKKNIVKVEKKPEAPQPCDGKSINMFHDSGIDGETCQGGRVKRRWGAGIRTVTCLKCKGSGFETVKPVIEKPKLGLIKFWFSKDGQFITVTGTDGKIRKQQLVAKKINLRPFSKDLNDYNIGKTISTEDILNLPSGSFVYFGPDRNDTPVVSMVINDTDRRRVYMLQDRFSGTTPDEYGLMAFDEWRKLSTYSWVISTYGGEVSCKLLTLKDPQPVNNDDLVETNWYEINNLINLRHMSISDVRDMDFRLKNAHFAIILDFNKLENTDYTSTSIIKSKRDDQKRNVLKLESPEDIKSANIARYIDTLSKNFNIGKGLSEINKVIPRSLGWSNSMIFLLNGTNMQDIKNVISRIYSIMRVNNEDDKNYYNNDIVTKLRNMYNKASTNNKNINIKIQNANKNFRTLTIANPEMTETYSKSSEVLNTFLELGNTLNKKISTPVETLSDMEILFTKVLSIKEIWDGERFTSLRKFRYVAEYLTSSWDYNIASEIYDNFSIEQMDDIISELKEFNSIIEKI